MSFVSIPNPQTAYKINEINRKLETNLNSPEFKPSLWVVEHTGEEIGSVDDRIYEELHCDAENHKNAKNR